MIASSSGQGFVTGRELIEAALVWQADYYQVCFDFQSRLEEEGLEKTMGFASESTFEVLPLAVSAGVALHVVALMADVVRLLPAKLFLETKRAGT